MKSVVVSLSGGMDSSTLLLRALSEYDNVIAVSFDYGQKHRVELERAQSLVDYLATKGKKVTYRQIQLNGLVDLLDSSLVTGGQDVPEGHYEQDNMKETVVPNRNKIFSSIIQAVALSIANEKNTEVKIAMGIHAGDHAIYPDCRQEFRDIDYAAFCAGNWGADRVQYYTPYLSDDKAGILKDGERCCEYLHLNFDKVYAKTNTSYKPMQHTVYWEDEKGETQSSIEWFSDYKSASSVERVEAFIKLGRKDPVQYADEFGPVTWHYVVFYVSSIIEEHETSI